MISFFYNWFNLILDSFARHFAKILNLFLIGLIRIELQRDDVDDKTADQITDPKLKWLTFVNMKSSSNNTKKRNRIPVNFNRLRENKEKQCFFQVYVHLHLILNKQFIFFFHFFNLLCFALICFIHCLAHYKQEFLFWA